MRNNDDTEFYRDRQRAAIAMSEAAAEPAIRGIHLAMARRYADLAGELRLRANVAGAAREA
ncbi:hypothetical protein [uncultured Sphingomonas sp.]|uniref:hypothetical protein n=1 Tax=uncultured Sphingomonas sp. TaxID=158754 RepID=UPI0035C9D245